MMCSFCMILSAVTTGVGGTSTLTRTEFKEKPFLAVFSCLLLVVHGSFHHQYLNMGQN
jgi:hypothetical protein